jgi:hypothetical protein
MSGSDEDPGNMTDSEKLDRILGQLATMNNRLDAHAQRLALLEQEPVQPTGLLLAPPLAATTLSTGPALKAFGPRALMWRWRCQRHFNGQCIWPECMKGVCCYLPAPAPPHIRHQQRHPNPQQLQQHDRRHRPPAGLASGVYLLRRSLLSEPMANVTIAKINILLITSVLVAACSC